MRIQPKAVTSEGEETIHQLHKAFTVESLNVNIKNYSEMG